MKTKSVEWPRSVEWPKSVALLSIGAAIPLVLAGFLIMMEHWDVVPSSVFNALPWQLNVMLLILPGIIPISYLRWAVEWRLVAGLLYLLAMFALMPLFGLIFACTFTGDCL